MLPKSLPRCIVIYCPCMTMSVFGMGVFYYFFWLGRLGDMSNAQRYFYNRRQLLYTYTVACTRNLQHNLGCCSSAIAIKRRIVSMLCNMRSKLIPTNHIYIHKYRNFLSFHMFLNPHMYLKILLIV